VTHDKKLANLTEKFETKCTSVTLKWGSTVWIHWILTYQKQIHYGSISECPTDNLTDVTIT